MCSDIAIRVQDLGKHYHIYQKPADRLKQMLFGRRRQYYREFHALSHINFELRKGEVLGLVGRNGAGKSTLLQIICGTLTPSHGTVEVNGRVAALLELGAGFNPDFTGRENVYLNASVLGLSKDEIDARYDSIVEFAGIGDFIHQPVKTYSSGMYVRLAFAIATSVDPDILVVDEALSVGDGAFSRKSFDRIMSLREKGVTILFCSHSMYQIESICNTAIWLEKGQQKAFGSPAAIVTDYQASLNDTATEQSTDIPIAANGHARLSKIRLLCDGVEGKQLSARSLQSDIVCEVSFQSDPNLPAPAVAFTIDNAEWRMVASALSLEAGEIIRQADGSATVQLHLKALPLLKGRYSLSVYLTCERGLHFYDAMPHELVLDVTQSSTEQGIFHLPRQWHLAGAVK